MPPSSDEPSAKLEDYLETILRLTREHGHAHLRDIAADRGVKNPSANFALNSLKSKGLVEYEKYSPATLTEKGVETAVRLLERRKALTAFFEGVLGVETSEARSAACKVEHILKEDIMKKISELVKYIENMRPRCGGGCRSGGCPSCAAGKPCADSSRSARPSMERAAGK